MTDPHEVRAARFGDVESLGRPHHTSPLYLTIGLVAAAIFAFAIPLNHDVAWTLTAAEQMRDGDALYRDILDINPPLIFWFARGVIGLSDLTGLTPESMYVLSILLLIGLVARSMGRRALLLVAVATIAAGRDFGQREHLIVLLALPAVLGRGEWWAGMGLGLAIALKPFYLPLWAVSLFMRRHWGIADWVVLGTGAAYLAAVAAWSPDFLALVRVAGDAYARWRGIGPLELLM